jgi:SAM-dependent methyltransferase
MSEKTVREYYKSISEEDFPCYKGIPMLCENGLHEILQDLAEDFLSKGQKILDVGCGRGAFSLRMHDRGFNVDACDVYDHCLCKDKVNFINAKAENTKFEQIYDAVFMIEMLEHTESPFTLIRQYNAYVKNNGYMILTTPNVDSDISRTWFFLKGRHWYFDDHNVNQDGHITPVQFFQFKYLFDELGLRIVKKIDVLENRDIRIGFLWSFIQLLRLYQRAMRIPARDGKIAIYVVKKEAN